MGNSIITLHPLFYKWTPEVSREGTFLCEVELKISDGGAGVTVWFLCLFFLLHQHLPKRGASLGGPWDGLRGPRAETLTPSSILFQPYRLQADGFSSMSDRTSAEHLLMFVWPRQWASLNSARCNSIPLFPLNLFSQLLSLYENWYCFYICNSYVKLLFWNRNFERKWGDSKKNIKK